MVVSDVEKRWQRHLAVLAAVASGLDLTLQAVCLGRGLSGAGDSNWTVHALRPAGGGQPGAQDQPKERLSLRRYGDLRLCLASCGSYDTLRGEKLTNESEACILKCVSLGSRYSEHSNDEIEFLRQWHLHASITNS